MLTIGLVGTGGLPTGRCGQTDSDRAVGLLVDDDPDQLGRQRTEDVLPVTLREQVADLAGGLDAQVAGLLRHAGEEPPDVRHQLLLLVGELRQVGLGGGGQRFRAGLGQPVEDGVVADPEEGQLVEHLGAVFRGNQPDAVGRGEQSGEGL